LELSGYFLLNTLASNRLCAADNNMRFSLPLHSIALFKDWIDEVSAGESLKISVGVFIVFLITIFKF
jgi:hypothetical protein